MKKLKLRILSLVLCVCMMLSVFTGCSLFVPNTEKENAKTALVIGDEVITKEELTNLYYSFYQQNQYYFYYYSEDQIIDVFYRSIVANKVALQEAKKLLADGTLVVTEEDYKEVWENVFDFVYDQVNSQEKNLLTSKGLEDKDLPDRLQSESSDDEKAYKFEQYEFEKVDLKTASGESATAPDQAQKIEELKAYIYKYNTVEDEEEKVLENIPEEQLQTRKKAFEIYLSNLIMNAKASKKSTKKEQVFKAEIERVYKSYYESMLYTKYQEYINSTSAGTPDGKFSDHYTNAIIANKYKELLNASTENNEVENNYTKIITSTDNDTLVLHHYNGKYQFFSVQHILVSYSDEVLNTLKSTQGYDTAKDKEIRDYYEQIRKALVEDRILEMTTTYRDDKGFTVKDEQGNKKTITIEKIREEFDAQVALKTTELENSSSYQNMTAEEKEIAKTRVRTLLFNEFAWKYSGDTGSLTNEKLSGVLGFTISEEDNNHGSFVKDFTNGARSMFKKIDSGDKKIGEEIEYVVSDYGVHIMMVTGSYEAGNVVDVLDKTDDQIVQELKSNFVSNLTTQTLYEYVYDMIKEETIGSKGTYFSDYRNSIVKSYQDANKIVYKNKMSYKELNEAISR